MKHKIPCLTLIGILLMLTPLTPCWAGPSDTATFVKAYYPDMQTVLQIRQMDVFDDHEMNREDGYLVIKADPAQQEELKTMGFVLQPYPDYDLRHNRDETVRRAGTIPGYACYKLVETGFEIMDEIVALNPNLASIVDIGDSWEKNNGNGGYDLRVLKLTNNSIPGPKPKLFVVGSIHAREYTTAELNIRFAQHLIDQYNTDPDVTWMLDHHEAHLLFYMNPDGRKHAEAGNSWRKNTNTNYCGATSSRRGCDLNRNFDYRWGSTGSSNECDLTYYGLSPASEPEVKSVQDYLQNIFTTDRQGIYIDLHSYGEVIFVANNAALRTMRAKFDYFNGYDTVAARPIEDPFLDRGGMTYEYGYYKLGVATFLFELGTSFFQSCSYFENNVLPGNLKALTYALRTCRAPFQLGYGPDAISLSIDGSTLTATIDDTNYGGSNNISTSNITQAEYYVDIPPWQNNAEAFPMSASDGGFDQKSEKIQASLNALDLETGRHTIFVRGQNEDGNWGPVSAIFTDGEVAPPAPSGLTTVP